MNTVLHIFSRSDHARAIFEGIPVPMLCGVEFYFETVNGEPVMPSGDVICLGCLDEIGPDLATQMLAERFVTQFEGAQ